MTDPSALLMRGVPEPGELLAGKYRIERVLGVGAMGVVMAATHLQLGEPVAIKFLSGALARDPERVTRFTREAWAAAKIKSEHVTRVSDVAQLESGTAYLVMEYLEGRDLDAEVQQGALPVQTAVDYVLQAAEALAEAHKLGITHRDLKPGNLFLTHRADGSACIKVLDFGISKFAGGKPMTQPESMMGSPMYMAPEQLLSATAVDQRVDVWALGVIVYELVTGVPPFDGKTIGELIRAVLDGRMRPLREVAPHVPDGFEAALKGCLAVRPDERYATLVPMAEALVQYGSPAARASVAFIRGVLLGASASAADEPALSQQQSQHVGDEPLAAGARVRPGGTGTKVSAGAFAPTVSARPPRPGTETAAPVSRAGQRTAARRGWLLGGVLALAAFAAVAGVSWLILSRESSPAAADGDTRAASSSMGSTPEQATEAAMTASSAESTDEPASSASASASTEPPEPSLRPEATAAAGSSSAPTAATQPRAPASSPPSPQEKPWNPYQDR